MVFSYVSTKPEDSSNKLLQAVNNAWSNMDELNNRSKVLPSGVLLKLMKRSDWEGCKRLFSNLSLVFLCAYAIYNLDVYHPIKDTKFEDLTPQTILIFIPLYITYGFLMQCLAFAGGHELHHGNAFKTKWMSTAATFFVSTAFFEVLSHERIMHKQHHKYTLDIDRDPELTSFYSRQELENLNFKSVPDSRYSYAKSYINVLTYFLHRVCRLATSCMGIATDYTGLSWSMKCDAYEVIDATSLRDLQTWSLLQLSIYVAIFSTIGSTAEGLKGLVFWWIAPCILGYAPINFVRNAEHADCDRIQNQLLNTRTVESNRLMRWVLWETNYHAEHHAYPAVPFYNLPILHELLKDHIKHKECRTFSSQNWNMLKKNGWIDQQKAGIIQNE